MLMETGGQWKGYSARSVATVDEYLETWKLKLSITKKVSAAFHPNNKEAKRELKVNHNNETLPVCSEPKYLGVTLDRSLKNPNTGRSRTQIPWSNVGQVAHESPTP